MKIFLFFSGKQLNCRVGIKKKQGRSGTAETKVYIRPNGLR